MVFRYFFKQKLHFLAMMCVKVCLHMFLLQINQINKIKNLVKVYPENKKHDLCVISIENQFLVSFSLDPEQRRVITLGPIFLKMVLDRAQGLKEKSHEVSARKNNNRLRYNKQSREGGFCPPPRPF